MTDAFKARQACRSDAATRDKYKKNNVARGVRGRSQSFQGKAASLSSLAAFGMSGSVHLLPGLKDLSLYHKVELEVFLSRVGTRCS